MKKKSEKVFELGYKNVKKYHSCAKGTFVGARKALNLDIGDKFDDIPRGFAEGGRTGGPCGACSSGVMIFGLVEEDEEEIYRLSTLLRNKFLDKYGGYTCKKIQENIFGRSYEFRDPIEKDLFHEKEDTSKCYEVGANSTSWIFQLVKNKKGIKNL